MDFTERDLPNVPTTSVKILEWNCEASGVTRGARGDIWSRAQNFGGAKLRSECYVLIT